ncbi:hypothetical protein D3C80_1741650 [compost metagenome]
MAAAQHPEALFPARGKFGRLVGHACDRKLRITEALIKRCDGQIEAGAPWRQNEIDLVLAGQTLGEPHRILGRGTVVIFDHFHRQALAIRQSEAAGIVDLLHP